MTQKMDFWIIIIIKKILTLLTNWIFIKIHQGINFPKAKDFVPTKFRNNLFTWKEPIQLPTKGLSVPNSINNWTISLKKMIMRMKWSLWTQIMNFRLTHLPLHQLLLVFNNCSKTQKIWNKSKTKIYKNFNLM